jgi:insulysin
MTAIPQDPSITDADHPAPKVVKLSSASFESIRKSDVDKCEYRLITLPNQMQVLLIHEAGLDKSSAAVDVHVGSFHDPSDISGVAHFLEHLLFMGTAKYPKENDYMEFLAAHGGQSNAFTDDEHTNYFFEVSADHFEAALDRFAQFFVAPLFNEDGTMREMQAVDSEHKKNVKDDMWRIHQLERTLSDPEHPYSHFGTGSSETLNKPGIREVIVNFYKQHYSANIMKAVIYGRESLDQLSEWANSMFSAVPNHSYNVSQWPANPWTHIQKMVHIKTVKEMQTLYLGWQTGDMHTYNRAKPDVYLSHLIGHEGPGSLFSFLKKKNLVLGLSAGFDENFHGFSFFQITFELTPQGLKGVDDIIEATFQYLAMLRHVGPQEWIQKECKGINEITFRFKDKAQSSSSYAYKLAGQMQEYPPERILSGPLLIEDWDPELINVIIKLLSPDNFRAMLASSKFKTDATWTKEQWYGTVYKIEDIKPELIEKCKSFTGLCNPELDLPKPNEFIPEKLDYIGKIVAEPQQHPVKLSELLYFKQDDQFGMPKSAYFILFRTPLLFESALSSVMASLYIDAVKYALSELTYDAQLAGLSFELNSQADGFEVRVTGFSEKAPLLLERVCKMLFDLSGKLDETKFASIKDRYGRQLKSLKEEKPIWHASYYASGILQERLLHWREKLAVFDSVTLDQVVAFGAKACRSSSVVCLVDGNETSASALSVREHLVKTLKPAHEFPEYKTLKTIRIPKGDRVFNDNEILVPNPNSAIEYYLQVGELSNAKQRQSCQLLIQLFSEAFFDQLRTKEQLGYMVYQQPREKGITVGIRMAIQSERDPIYLESRIDAFLAQVIDRINEMSDEEFSKYKHSLISDLTANKKKLSQEAKAFWEEIMGCRYEFEKHLVDARGVAELGKLDIIDFAKNFVVADAPERRKLAIHIWSDTKKEALADAYTNRTVITDIQAFVKECALLDVSYEIPK